MDEAGCLLNDRRLETAAEGGGACPEDALKSTTTNARKTMTPKREIPFDEVDLFGVGFRRFREADCVRNVTDEIGAGRGGWIVTPNLEILRLLPMDAKLRAMLREADLVVADGMPLVWLSRLLGDALPERVAGSSLVSTLSAAAAADRRSVYLLGGDPGTAEGAARVLESRYPGLRIAGTACPKPGFEQSPAAVRGFYEGVESAEPDLVFVALGFPKQERVIRDLRPELPRTWFMGVGISFSYLSGDVRRAPAWIRKTGLEWIYRLGQEPGRLARRYLAHDVPFGLQLMGRAMRQRFRTTPPREIAA